MIKLKYRLAEFKEINELTYKYIATFCNVTERQVLTWSQIEKDSTVSISADKLKMLSELFSCSMEAMYNKDELITA